ncbi:protoheme IX farnesyltransferase [Opitutaceae bacterium EW11]|nr:protoheme IX farnesyltransferase [Opitutaceae bacterium EW11]
MSDVVRPLSPSAAASLAVPRARFGDYLELTKPRLSLLSVITAVVGYFSALPKWDPAKFLFMMVGTCLCAAGVAALNQWMESDTDALMKRTADRPIPSGKVPTGSAFVLGWACCALGLALLFSRVNGFAAVFALATIVSYLALYTPAKRWSRWSTEIGAVAGAFPPLIGWAASEHHNPVLGWVLFGVLFFWQVPHFMAIGWMYRADYEAVHFPMLPVRDAGGGKVARWSFFNAVAAVVISAVPAWTGLASGYYLAATLLFGAWFVARAARFLRPLGREAAAKRLFLASIGWLPLQLAALVLDRWIRGA